MCMNLYCTNPENLGIFHPVPACSGASSVEKSAEQKACTCTQHTFRQEGLSSASRVGGRGLGGCYVATSKEKY